MAFLPAHALPAATLPRLVRGLAAGAALLIGMAAAPPSQAHGRPHQHGVAQLDVVQVGRQIAIELRTPLDNLVGFERAPRTAAERQRVERMQETLKQVERVFVLPAAGLCRPTPLLIDAPVLGLGAAAPAGAKDAGHADLTASVAFDCEAPGTVRQIDVELFAIFSGFKRIEVQLATPGGQARRVLTPAARRIEWPR